MNGVNSKQVQMQNQTPKRSLLSYLCPCFNFESIDNFNKNQKSSMNHTEQSNSTVPLDPNKPKESLTEIQMDTNYQLEQPHKQLKESMQSGIYIQFKENESENQQKSENAVMQQQYERYMKQEKKPKKRYFPINSIKENQLVLVGNQTSKMLCKIKTVYVESSEASRKKQRQAQKSKEKSTDLVIQKYWEKRYFLFQKFDQGIKLDQQSWFSVTPQAVAEHLASRLSGFDTVLDGFCGSGGDSIKLGLNCKKVISNDIDEMKIQLLINNAAVYGIDNIETLSKDFFDLQFKRNSLDAVYSSPPWGGPDYLKLQAMFPQDFLPPLQQVITKSISLSDNVIILLPNNTDINSLPSIIYKAYDSLKLIPNTSSILLQKIFFEGKFKFIALHVGAKVTKINLGDELEYIYRLLADSEGIFIYKRVVKKIRQECGMLRLLNYAFECEKISNKKISIYQKLIQFLIDIQLISKQKITKIQQLDESEALKSNKGKKQRKQEKKMMKSMIRSQTKPTEVSLALTYNQVQVAPAMSSPSKKEQQTISYISSISQSKMVQSVNMHQNPIMNPLAETGGVLIEAVEESNIFYKEPNQQ